MNIPFNMGDPVQLAANPSKVGKVIGLIEPTYDTTGVAIRFAQIVVQPPLKKYTSLVYYEEELTLCRCANRGAGIKRSVKPCEESVPF